MDLTERLDVLTELVESARAMPMSASCMLNRSELLDAIEEVRAAVPEEMTSAARVLADRDRVLDAGRARAEEILAEARESRQRMVSSADVVTEATTEAERIIDDAVADANRMRDEVDEYVDARLASFEVVLHKTLAAVERGREKLSGRPDEISGLSEVELSREPVEPLPS